MIVLLLGPPGAGKGTQGERIAAALRVPKLATGDVLRAAVNAGTPRGLEAKRYMERGDLVPDEVILGVIKEELSRPEFAPGVVLDGVVRTTPQAQGLQRALAELGRQLDAVLLFEVDAEELISRLSGRTVCEKCQTPYTGRDAGSVCDKCGGRLVRRADDDPIAVRRRLVVYEEQTSPVVKWYETSSVPVHRVDAKGSIDDITARALAGLTGDSAKE
jgi:adenylate kinase